MSKPANSISKATELFRILAMTLASQSPRATVDGPPTRMRARTAISARQPTPFSHSFSNRSFQSSTVFSSARSSLLNPPYAHALFPQPSANETAKSCRAERRHRYSPTPFRALQPRGSGFEFRQISGLCGYRGGGEHKRRR